MCYFCNNHIFNADEFFIKNKNKARRYIVDNDGETDEAYALTIRDNKSNENPFVQIEDLPSNINELISTTDVVSAIIPRAEITITNYVITISIECEYLRIIPKIISTKKKTLLLSNTINIETNDISDIYNLEITNCNIKRLNNINNIEYLLLSGCNYLESINNIKNVGQIEINSCPKLYNIGNVSNTRKLEIDDCKKLVSYDNLTIREIYNCDNLMKILNYYRHISIVNNSYYVIHGNEMLAEPEINYNKVINGIQKIEELWKLRKFVKFCNTKEFTKWFWAPPREYWAPELQNDSWYAGIGGRWDMKNIEKTSSSMSDN